MKYFQVLLLAALFLVPAGLVWHFLHRLRADFMLKIFSRAVRRFQQKKNGYFYATWAARKIVRRAPAKIVRAFCDGKTQPLETYVAAHLPETNSWFQKMLCKKDMPPVTPEKSTDSDKLLQALALCYEGRLAEMSQKLETVNAEKFNRSLKGVYLLLGAWDSLYGGDLLSASEQASRAVRLFVRSRDYYEEAQAHLLLGTIYRVSAVSDTSRFMLQTAQKLFHHLEAFREEATAWGNLGMLKVMDCLWEEASADFSSALKIYEQAEDIRGQAEIINQQALSALICKDFKTARSTAGEALKKHRKLSNRQGEAFSTEILSRIAQEEENWPAAAELAAAAAGLYDLENNVPAWLETSMIEADALWRQGKEQDAEKVLRQMLEKHHDDAGCYNMGNIYNFLGLIYLQRNDLSRAKGFFQQSLDCEMSASRNRGAAIDYANLAEVDRRRGLTVQALETLQKACEYAEAAGDEALISLLRHKSQKLRHGHIE